MDLNEFTTRHFRPRDHVREDVEELLVAGLKKIPTEGAVNVVIADQGKSFLISIVGRAGNKFFSSESIHFKESMWGWSRDWQVAALYRVLTDFRKQIGLYLSKARK